MAPLVNEDVAFVVDIDDIDFLSSEFKAETSGSGPLHTKDAKASRRSVSFHETVVIHEVMNREGYTYHEVVACWYDRSDLRQMKDNARSEARLVQSGILVEGDDISIRGLESKTSEGARRKRQYRMNAYAAVFFEIETQNELGIVDEDAIADVYFNYSEHCQISAQMMAIRDADDVSAMDADAKNMDYFGANMLFNLSAAENIMVSNSAAA